MTATEVHRKYGPCRLLDADGDIVLGKIVEVNLETGEYVVIRLDDRGWVVAGFGGALEYEKCQAKPPLTLRPIEKGDPW